MILRRWSYCQKKIWMAVEGEEEVLRRNGGARLLATLTSVQ
jgi:hypothetical protein